MLPVLGKTSEGRNTRKGWPVRRRITALTTKVVASTATARPATSMSACRSRFVLPMVATIRQGVVTRVTSEVTIWVSKGLPARAQP